jgi:hypothetical protein
MRAMLQLLRPQVHPAVKAVVPVNTTCRLTSINYRDGPLHLELVVRWSGYLWSLTRDTYSLLVLVRGPSHTQCLHPPIRARIALPDDKHLSPFCVCLGPSELTSILWLLLYMQLLSLGRGLKFLGYLGVCDHPALTRAMRHLPVNEITSECLACLP